MISDLVYAQNRALVSGEDSAGLSRDPNSFQILRDADVCKGNCDACERRKMHARSDHPAHAGVASDG
jgi:hypothetical protein